MKKILFIISLSFVTFFLFYCSKIDNTESFDNTENTEDIETVKEITKEISYFDIGDFTDRFFKTNTR